jgi:multidrug efflux pump subunit AcrA (membrane-fusion protein)
MRLLYSVHIAVALLVLTAASGCTRAAAREARPPHPVKTEAVGVAPTPSGLRYSATIEPAQQVSLAFKASGYVDAVLQRSGPGGRLHTAQQGDRVSRGLVLARVRETEYRERVNQGRARVAESEASLVKARLDLERARALFTSQSLTKPSPISTPPRPRTTPRRRAWPRRGPRSSSRSARSATPRWSRRSTP